MIGRKKVRSNASSINSDIPSHCVRYNRYNIGDNMISYNQELIVESDEHRYGNYYIKYLMFPFPEESVELLRADEEMRYQLNKPIITMRSDSNNCQKGD